MRAALGASRWDLIWTLLAEVLLICALGALFGVLAATRLLDPLVMLLSRAAEGFPRADAVGVNGVVLAFSAAVTCLTVIVAGLLPALSASRPAPWEALQQSRRSRGGRAVRRTQRSLLLVEAALATVLLAVAGLLTRSVLYVSSVDPGFESERVAYLTLEMSGARYDSTTEAQTVGQALEARLRALPQVEAVARVSALPAVGNADGKLMWLPQESAEDARLVWASEVSPDYFGTMGIRVVAGRAFAPSDGPGGARVAVISELLAERFFPGVDPVGRALEMSTDTRIEGGKVVAGEHADVTVVGVASEVRQLAVMLEPDAMVYLPIAQASGQDPTLILRTSGPPADVLDAARAEIRALDATLLVSETDVLERAMSRVFAPVGVRTVLVVVLAALAAFLTAVGIYGVVTYVVSDQLHEIGVRMALGARAGGESRRVIVHALSPVIAGGLLGLVGAWAVSRLVASDLFGVKPLDPLTYLGVLALITSVTCAAAWLPARRAASVDPVRVLNDE
jgi:predicted permease